MCQFRLQSAALNTKHNKGFNHGIMGCHWDNQPNPSLALPTTFQVSWPAVRWPIPRWACLGGLNGFSPRDTTAARLSAWLVRTRTLTCQLPSSIICEDQLPLLLEHQAEENPRELMQPELGKPHRVHDGQWLLIYLFGIYYTYVPVTLLYNILRTNSNIKLCCYLFGEYYAYIIYQYIYIIKFFNE